MCRARPSRYPEYVDLVAATAAPPAKPGRLVTTIGGYRITGIVGSGGFAVTYAGRHPTIGAVAIKVLSRNWLHNANVRTRFEQECEILASRAALDDADRCTVVPYYIAHGISDGVPYLVSELCTGGDLAARSQELARGSPADRLGPAAWVGAAASRALPQVHERLGVVHRDLTPGNLLFRAGGLVASSSGASRAGPHEELVIADFGLMKEAALQSNFSRVVGTAAYTAPEVQRYGTCDHRSDTYSLGIISWELLTGRRAPSGQPPAPLGQVEPLLPAELAEAVEAMVSDDPWQRPRLDELAGVFDRYATDAPPGGGLIVAPLPGSNERPLLRQARRIGTAAVAVAAGSALVGGIGLASPPASAEPYSPPDGGFVIDLDPSWVVSPATAAQPGLRLQARDHDRGLLLEVRQTTIRDAATWLEARTAALGDEMVLTAAMTDDGEASIRSRSDVTETVAFTLTPSCGTLILTVSGGAPLSAESAEVVAGIGASFRATGELTVASPPSADDPPGFRRLERNGLSIALPSGYTHFDGGGCLNAFGPGSGDGWSVAVEVDPDESIPAAIEGYRRHWSEIGARIVDVTSVAGTPRIVVDHGGRQDAHYLFQDEEVVHVVRIADSDDPLSRDDLILADQIASTFEVRL